MVPSEKKKLVKGKRSEVKVKKVTSKYQERKKVDSKRTKNTSIAFSKLRDRIRRIKPNKTTGGVGDDDLDNLDADFVDIGPIEEEESFGNHDKLVQSIKSIKKSGTKMASIEVRKEPVTKVSELNLTTRYDLDHDNDQTNDNEGVKDSDPKTSYSTRGRLNVADLLSAAKDVTGVIDKSVKRLKKKKLINPPLNSIESALIERRANHEQVVKKVSKWQPVVDAHAVASQLIFPLDTPSLHMDSSQEVTSRYKSRNEMEAKIDSLLNQSKNHLKDDAILTPAEEEYLKTLSLEEAQERHSQLQKMRALLSYQEAKLRRRKKIKSRSFRRILKKDKLKEAMKEFEELKERDPERALQKLSELDKIRALERVTLRHKSTGRWAKHNKLRATYDDNARAQLADQVELSKVLMKKRKLDESDDEDTIGDANFDPDADRDANFDVEDDAHFKIPNDFNPWMKSQRSLLEEKIRMSKGKEKGNDSDHETDPDHETNPGHDSDPNKRKREVKTKEIKASYYQRLTDLVSDDSDDDEEDGINAKLISEAFANDDVIVEFEKDKEAHASEEAPKDVDNFLPGWGSWHGPGGDTNLEAVKKKREKFIIKASKRERKDAKLGNVIISEKANASIQRLQVKQLPRDLKSVPEFESLISTPIGRTWNTQLSFQSLTEPSVVTKMGTIIEPMNTDSLAPFSSKKSYERMKKMKKAEDAKKK